MNAYISQKPYCVHNNNNENSLYSIMPAYDIRIEFGVWFLWQFISLLYFNANRRKKSNCNSKTTAISNIYIPNVISFVQWFSVKE